ncbi:hypothetical protein ACQEUU_13045 [Nonomuraea sp. CA-218870]|uniref:hypothetical protein n=1 Tax=Nonomuraea sp. CA-218870 TaxID=3239998 RepID=UPI003D8E24A7
MTENDRQPLVEGITAAIVGVTDFGPHLDLFRDELGYEVAGEGVSRRRSPVRCGAPAPRTSR